MCAGHTHLLVVKSPQHTIIYLQLSALIWWWVSTNLNSVGHGADGIICDIIQAQLKGCHHHAGLQLAPCREQQSMSAETHLLFLTTHFPGAERLSTTQRILRLETMLKTQTRHKNIQVIQTAARSVHAAIGWLNTKTIKKKKTWYHLILLTSNFCLEEHFFFPFGLPGFEAVLPCHCNGPAPSSAQKTYKKNSASKKHKWYDMS